MKRKLLLTFFILISSKALFGQGQGYNWCFGDSANIKFIGGTMVAQPFSAAQSIEANASVSDDNGNLLFYVTSTTQNGLYLRIYDKNHQMMLNGDSIYGYSSSTNGVMIVPFPNDTTKYYVFTNRIDFLNPSINNYNLVEQIIDLSQNGGNGGVIQKNIILLNQHVCEKTALIKHGNGKDWWFLVHNTDGSSFYIYLIDSSGIHNPLIQTIGTEYNLYSNLSALYKGHWGEMVFSNDGSRMAVVSLSIIDYFQFNRCTGVLSNYQNLANPFTSFNEDNFYSCSFSPNDSVLYVTMNPDAIPIHSDLYQFDLSASDIKASRQTIYSLIDSTSFGQMQIAPDGRIYVVTGHNGFPNYIFVSSSMSLSTIENPDNLGLTCNFQLHSFFLNGHRAFFGLPNMPNYNLGPLPGSPCDTILSVSALYPKQLKGLLYPNPNNGIMKYEYMLDNFHGTNFVIYDMQGRKIASHLLNKNQHVLEIDHHELAEGVYRYEVVSDTNETKDSGKIVIVK